MANWWEAITVNLTRGDLDCAWNWASIATPRCDTGSQRQDLAASYWTPFEASQYGHICEHIFHRFSSEPLHCDPSRAHTRDADVGGWEVKGTPWRNIEHFHLSAGGRIFVPDHVRHPIVATSYFLRNPMRGQVDGWLPWQDAMQAPYGGRVRGDSGKRAHMIRYADLFSAATIPS